MDEINDNDNYNRHCDNNETSCWSHDGQFDEEMDLIPEVKEHIKTKPLVIGSKA